MRAALPRAPENVAGGRLGPKATHPQAHNETATSGRLWPGKGTRLISPYIPQAPSAALACAGAALILRTVCRVRFAALAIRDAPSPAASMS